MLSRKLGIRMIRLVNPSILFKTPSCFYFHISVFSSISFQIFTNATSYKLTSFLFFHQYEIHVVW